MEYRRLLLEISRSVKPNELKDMVFLCANFLKDDEQQALENGEVKDFFLELERKKKLSVNKLKFLHDLLKNVQRPDLASKITELKSQWDGELGVEEVDNATNQIDGTISRLPTETIPVENYPQYKYMKLTVQCMPYLAGITWGVFSIYLLKQHKDDPKALIKVTGSVVLPVGYFLKSLFHGSTMKHSQLKL